jgi:hypothetical protein
MSLTEVGVNALSARQRSLAGARLSGNGSSVAQVRTMELFRLGGMRQHAPEIQAPSEFATLPLRSMHHPQPQNRLKAIEIPIPV